MLPPVTNAWTVGRRVQRPNGGDSGTIIETAGTRVKVKWDSGRTSYFERGRVPYALLNDSP